jgi:hypothetical protein
MWNECGGTWIEGPLHTINIWIILKKLTLLMSIFFSFPNYLIWRMLSTYGMLKKLVILSHDLTILSSSLFTISNIKVSNSNEYKIKKLVQIKIAI